MPKDPAAIERVILVCSGSRCKRAGAKEIAREVRATAKRLGLKKSTHVVRTRCNGMCERCPVVSVQPDNLWITEATVATARSALLASVRGEEVPAERRTRLRVVTASSR